MLRRTLLMSLAFALFSLTAFASSGEIMGKVTDEITGEGLPFAHVLVKSPSYEAGFTTDEQGLYSAKPLPPGTYSVEVSYVSFQTQLVTDIPVRRDESVLVDFALEIPMGLEVIIGAPRPYKSPLIDPLNPSVCPRISKGDLKRQAIRNPKDALTTLPGVKLVDGELSIRASRSGSTLLLVDGVKIRNINSVSLNSIESMQVLNSFVPAKYGDTTGGVVLIETRSYATE